MRFILPVTFLFIALSSAHPSLTQTNNEPVSEVIIDENGSSFPGISILLVKRNQTSTVTTTIPYQLAPLARWSFL